jgi:hypothetical protein
MTMIVDYCGERVSVPDEGWLTIGREGDVVIDDNPYLHRRFLQVGRVDGLFWLVNVGDQLAATVTDPAGRVQAWLAPGARLPLVFEITLVRFTAGPTTYEVELVLEEPPFSEPVSLDKDLGDTTIGLVPLTADQRLLILSLAEPLLRQDGRGSAAVPSSAEAARRLGWKTTRFNRKLDNVCQKLSRIGVRGLHGSPGELASNRRARLVEYAVSVRLVTPEDLALLDEVHADDDVDD